MTSIVSSAAVVVCLLSVPASIVAQQPSATPPPLEKASAKTTNATPPPAPPYSYDPQGRRDPFLSLVARGSDPGSAATRPAGLPGLLISEVAVKGVVRDRSGLIAMVQGPGTKTFIVRPGEKLMDGAVKAITNDSVVFAQDVNDPLSMVKQKEVRKTVRSADGGRE